MSFVYLPVASGINPDPHFVERISQPFANPLERLGGRAISQEQVACDEPFFLFVLSGGTERIILELQALREQSFPREPVCLIAHPDANSLPAAMEVLARLQQDGAGGQILYLNGPTDETGLARIGRVVEDIAVLRQLRSLRIGMVGTPSDWLVASTTDPLVVKRQWGAQVVEIALDDVKAGITAASESDLAQDTADISDGAGQIREPAPRELKDAVAVYQALQQVVARHELDALTVRCFDLVLDLKTTGCYALSRLTDEGVVAGCEGDIMSTLGMVWVHKLLQEIPWMANPAQLDPQQNRLWLAHCTVPRKIVRAYDLRSHFESGLGVGIQGTLAPGPVTLLRIGGRKLNRVWLAEGQILQNGTSEALCRTQVEIQLTAGGCVDDLLTAPLGNHLVMVRGHHRERLAHWWHTMGPGGVR